MVGTFFELLFMSALVGGATYLLYRVSHQEGHVNADGRVKRKSKRNEETGEKQNRKTGHFALDKWLGLGGGYYGTVGLVTLIVSEIAETLTFLFDWQALVNYFSDIGIHMIVDFFVNQFTMFINALIWPTNYLEGNGIWELAVMIALSYSAYRWAQGYARTQHQKLQEEEKKT